MGLANTIISGSIGGTILEFTVISVNLITIQRLINDKRVALWLMVEPPKPRSADNAGTRSSSREGKPSIGAAQRQSRWHSTFTSYQCRLSQTGDKGY